MSPSSETVALTGASGSLGAVVLEHLIDQNYNVNAILRSFAKSKTFLEEKYPRAVTSGQLSFTEIPDMSTSGCFDAVLASADKFIHCATPLSHDDFEEKMFKPTAAIMNNVLSGAKKSAILKRVVITGSIIATLQFPKDWMSGKTISPKDYNPIKRSEAEDSLINAYQYSKTTAELQAWDFMKTEQPNFDLIFILSPSITGKSIEQGWRSNRIHPGGISGIYRCLFDVETPAPVVSWFQDIDDVADMHIKSIDAKAVPGNKRYVASAGYMDSNEMARKIRAEFPELRGRVPDAPEATGPPEGLFKLDVTETDQVFGNNWKSAWDSARQTVMDILETERKHGIQPMGTEGPDTQVDV